MTTKNRHTPGFLRGWEEMHSGELVHVGPDLEVDRATIMSGPPAHPMVLSTQAQVTQDFD